MNGMFTLSWTPIIFFYLKVMSNHQYSRGILRRCFRKTFKRFCILEHVSGLRWRRLLKFFLLEDRTGVFYKSVLSWLLMTWRPKEPMHQQPWHWPSSPGTPGPWFNIKMSSYQYRKSHCRDKTVVRSSYLHNGISYTGKMTSLYWIGAQKG